MLNTFDREHVRAPFANSWWMGKGYIGLEVFNTTTVNLTNLWVEERFRMEGEGRRMLLRACGIATFLGVRLRTWVRPFDPHTANRLDSSDLTAWYTRRGFVPIRNGYLVRDP